MTGRSRPGWPGGSLMLPARSRMALGVRRRRTTKLSDPMRKSLARLLAHAYAIGARRMLGLVSERFREYVTAQAQGEDIDIRTKLMVDALILEQEALQYGESMVARLERWHGRAQPPSDAWEQAPPPADPEGREERGTD